MPLDPAPSPDLWVFGYGSLMWNPGFAFAERRKATLEGFTRRLCIWSHIYRGTPEVPGLVFGLAPGGACHGVAFRVEADLREATLSYLRERELPSYVYLEIETPALLDDGRRVNALTYVADHDNPQFAGALPEDEMLAIIRRSKGKSGLNVDYVLNTHAELRRLDIEDAELDAICERLAG
jgi:glutathione-specific gamma-glutamylcyclotransferase